MQSVQIRSFFRFIFSCIQSESRKIRTRKISLFGHISRSEKIVRTIKAENSRLRALGHPFIVNLLFKVWWLNHLPLLLILPKSKGLVMPHQLILSQFSFSIPPENVRKPTVTEVFKEYRNRALASRKSVWFCPENICFFNVFRGHRNGTFA